MNKKILLLIGSLLLTFSVSAQEQAKESTKEKKVIVRELPVYRDVDVMATYRGGYDVLLKQIEKATKNCKRGKIKSANSTIVMDVLVTDKGKVARIDFVKNETDLCVNEIRSVLEKATQWVPGKINNKPVNSFLQFTFNLN